MTDSRSYPDMESDALDRIWDIVHTPSKATNHRSAERHFMADFDAIRQVIKDFRTRTVAQGMQNRDETLRGLAEFFSESVHHVWSNDEIADCLTSMIGQGSSLTSTHSRCAKCHCETKGEAALVDGKIWCHPCADSLTSTSRCTCAAIVNPNIPHARTCPLSSTVSNTPEGK